MSIKVTIIPFGIGKEKYIWIRHKGMFDFEKIYKLMRSQLKQRKYKFHEKAHQETVQSDGKEIKLEFTGSKSFDDYAKFHIEINIWALRINDIFMKDNGKKIKLQKGDLRIRFNGTLEMDYRNKFESLGKFGIFLRNLYNKYIIKDKINTKYAKNIYIETNELIKKVKALLDMPT